MMLNSPLDCPIGGLMIRRWVAELYAEGVAELHAEGVEHRRAVLLRTGLTCAVVHYNDVDRPGGEVDLRHAAPDATHELVSEHKVAGFLMLHDSGLHSQALRFIGVEPRGMNLTGDEHS